MPAPSAMTSFTANTRAKAAEVNSNFGSLYTAAATYAVYKDETATISAVHTHSATPVFSAGFSGTAGTLTAEAALTFSHASARFIPGATSLLFRNNANDATNFSISDAGAIVIRGSTTAGGDIAITGGLTTTGGVTVGNGLIVTAGGQTVTAGGITINGGGLTVASGTTATGAITCSTIVASSTVTGSAFAGASITKTAGNVLLGGGVVATNATTGMPRMSTAAGTPTGNPAENGVFVYDSSNNRLYIHNGAGWNYVQLTT